MIHGKFITLEGGEGVGKSTNIAFIKERLENRRINVLQTREPGGTALAEKIRALLLEKHDEKICDETELLLMFAARAQHIKNVIYPALLQGTWVICDRFTEATYAYQGGGRNMDVSTISWLENLIQGAFRPDLTLLLDAPVEVGLKRATERAELDRFESEKIDFFKKVRSVYILLAEQNPDRIKIINANQTLSGVRNDIMDTIDALLTSSNDRS